MPFQVQRVEGEAELGWGERVEQRRVGGSHGGSVGTCGVFYLEPHVRAGVVGVESCHVRVAEALGEDYEPWLDGSDVSEGGGDRTLPGI